MPSARRSQASGSWLASGFSIARARAIRPSRDSGLSKVRSTLGPMKGIGLRTASFRARRQRRPLGQATADGQQPFLGLVDSSLFDSRYRLVELLLANRHGHLHFDQSRGLRRRLDAPRGLDCGASLCRTALIDPANRRKAKVGEPLEPGVAKRHSRAARVLPLPALRQRPLRKRDRSESNCASRNRRFCSRTSDAGNPPMARNRSIDVSSSLVAFAFAWRLLGDSFTCCIKLCGSTHR